jgi:acyl carrier protein
MYRTGDFGRYLPGGDVEFVGRRDAQVKVRGHRVELGAIEAALARVPGVRQAAVTASGPPDARHLTAYLVAAGTDPPASAAAIRALEGVLPDFMVPRRVVWLDALPLTANGKVDLAALPRVEAPAGPATRPEPAVSATAEIVAGIWAEVLERPSVELDDDFFTLGGHSLLAVQVMSRVRQAFGLELPLRVLFDRPTISQLAACVDERRRPGDGRTNRELVRQPRHGDLELSFAQQRMWLLDRIESGSAAYHMAWAVEMKGPLHPDPLRGALEVVVARHEPLRTVFIGVEGRPRQRVLPPAGVRLPFTDLAGDREALSRLMAEEVDRPFDLAAGPPFRAAAYRLGPDEVVLLWVVHHIAFDGWSMGVLLRELGVAYDAVSSGLPVDLPELPVQYADFASWQREWLRSGEEERQLGYWRRRLAGAPAFIDLPTDRPRPTAESHRGARESFELPSALADRVAALSRAEGVTLFMTLLAAFKVLLSRYSGQLDLVVGSPIAGRGRPELEGLIGPFVNTLALRTDLTGDPSFRELLGRVRETALDAYAQQDVPFEKLVEALRPQRDLSRNPVFQVMFALQNAPLAPLRLRELQLRRVEVDRRTAQLDLSLHVATTADGLRGVFEYATDLFDAPTIRRMAGHYLALLESAVEDPERRASALSMMTEQETDQLSTWNATATPVPELLVHERVRAQAGRTPHGVAVEHDERRLSYAELQSRSARLSAHLRRRGVGAGSRVGVYLERSPEMVVGVLGILGAGAAYVPLDPAYPGERLSWMVEDSGLEVVVSQRSLAAALPAVKTVVWMDEEW